MACSIALPDRIVEATSGSLYHDLDDNEIRLVTIHPSRDFDASIQLSLHTTNFSDQPIYKAVSYVWGAPPVTSTIIVDGIDFEATTDLVSALRHVRHEHDTEIL
jgi:hypothetical protein